jgi:hypothetical protein
MTEKPSLFVHRVGDRLLPCAPLDAELIRAFDAKGKLRCVLTKPRNPDRLRFYFACLQLIRDNLDGAPSVEKLHEMVKVMMGYTITIKTKRDVTVLPASIAFDKMDESEFKVFIEDFKRLVTERIIPGIGTEPFERAALEMIE